MLSRCTTPTTRKSVSFDHRFHRVASISVTTAAERLDPSTSVSSTLQRLVPRKRLRLVVPEEWYRRPKSKSFTSHLPNDDEDTLKLVLANEPGPPAASEEAGENGDGTAKQSTRNSSSTPPSPDASNDRRLSSISSTSGTESSRRSTYSSNRLSSMFDGWLNLSPSTAALLPSQPNAAPERINVSSPTLIDPTQNEGEDYLVETDEQRAEFEQFMVFITN